MSKELDRIRDNINGDPDKALKALGRVRDWISDELPIPTVGATAMLVRLSTAINVLECLKGSSSCLASPPAKEVEITDEMVERLAVSVFDQDSDNDTVPWERQPSRYRTQVRRSVRSVLTAIRIHFPAALTNRTPDDEVGNG